MVIMECEIYSLTGSLYFTHLTVIFMIMFSSLQRVLHVWSLFRI